MARYDNYRIYNVEFSSEKHVQLFKELEEQSDSMSFIGHPREVGQKLSILVAAHKVADLTLLLKHYQVTHRILVGGSFTKNSHIFKQTHKELFRDFYFLDIQFPRKNRSKLFFGCGYWDGCS